MTHEVRILFTSVGRRVELMRAFKDASLCTGIPLRVYGIDMDETAPALLWCDEKRTACTIRDNAYIPQLLEICKSDNIDLLIPTIDTDLLLLSQNRERFEALGTKVFISDVDKVALCRDKRFTGAFFEECGLKAPITVDNWLHYNGPYPCFIKPKDGSSSINAYRVENKEQLEGYAQRIEDYVVQPFVDGREYTLDIFCDYEGQLLSAVPRERIAVRAGEVLKTRIDLDATMLAESEVIVNHFRPRGPMTVQLIRDYLTGEDWFIEINPRFGGGAPLSMRAGARTAEWVLRWLVGEEPHAFGEAYISDGVVLSRFDDSVIVRMPDGRRKLRGVIFDLDDTLYLERDYVHSGFGAIERDMGITGVADELWGYFQEGKRPIDEYVAAHGCPDLKDGMLYAYRRQIPEIHLDDDVREKLVNLRVHGMKLGIITDGRPEGQRAKLDALGLWELVDDVIITDELGGSQFRKPCDIAFRIIQRRWGIPYEQMAYVGDNPVKDFDAPLRLGMQALWLRQDEGLYSSESDEIRPSLVSLANIPALPHCADA